MRLEQRTSLSNTECTINLPSKIKNNSLHLRPLKKLQPIFGQASSYQIFISSHPVQCSFIQTNQLFLVVCSIVCVSRPAVQAWPRWWWWWRSGCFPICAYNVWIMPPISISRGRLRISLHGENLGVIRCRWSSTTDQDIFSFEFMGDFRATTTAYT